eukprot:gnl/TRDRNA2_/TRDRNA2_149255_c0_seq2.p1 gnl/TRDRNA2_/TRDRNA2_149255_c0~~gnl/TRDRNA2_/TRDRNA2_149255_c0_seq2.p1  ORF type:complete len:446 (-),score=62.05 gnl/TRDRNA2_/TRDRNA2_149255_c0_seq2:78-1415(-)
MPGPGLALTDPLIQESSPESTRGGNRVLLLPPLLLGLGSVGFLTLLSYVAHVEDRHLVTVQESLVSIARQLVPPAGSRQSTVASRATRTTRTQQFMQPSRTMRNTGFSHNTNAVFIPKAHRYEEMEPATLHEQAALDNSRVGPAPLYSRQAQSVLSSTEGHPDLFDSQVEEQLQTLYQQREEERELEQTRPADQSTLALRRRQAELRQTERALVATELVYLKVCNGFRQLQVPMIPTMQGGGNATLGAIDAKGLSTGVFSGSASELVDEQLSKILREQVMSASDALHRIPLFEVCRIYSVSMTFGYILRNLERRFQFEAMAGSFTGSLKAYISSFGPDLQQSMVSLYSTEAKTAMELQIDSLFGDHRALKRKFLNALGTVTSTDELDSKLAEIMSGHLVETIDMTSNDMTRLVFEAVAFGMLLNNVEKQVDAIYQLTPAVRSSQQ